MTKLTLPLEVGKKYVCRDGTIVDCYAKAGPEWKSGLVHICVADKPAQFKGTIWQDTGSNGKSGKEFRNDVIADYVEKGDYVKEMQFNINDYCSVILTGTGAAILNKNNAESNARFAHLGIQLTCKTDYKKGDTFKDQFWSMFQLFGAQIQLGMEAPFDSCQITLHTT